MSLSHKLIKEAFARGETRVKCPHCSGKGYDYVQVEEAEVKAQDCESCDATGYVPEYTLEDLREQMRRREEARSLVIEDLIIGINERAILDAGEGR